MPDYVEPAPLVLKLIRSRHDPRCVLADDNLDLYGFDELREWDYGRGRFRVIDPETGKISPASCGLTDAARAPRPAASHRRHRLRVRISNERTIP
jgi:hypothetical protein